jgi:hypothetical protein
MAGQEHSFRFSEREIFERGEPTSQIGLNRLRKFRFTRTRFGSEKARSPERWSGKLNRFCPSSGKSACSLNAIVEKHAAAREKLDEVKMRLMIAAN